MQKYPVIINIRFLLNRQSTPPPTRPQCEQCKARDQGYHHRLVIVFTVLLCQQSASASPDYKHPQNETD